MSCQKNNKTILVRNGVKFSKIQLVLNGTINIYDFNLNLINFYDKDEIMGIKEF